MHKEIVMQESNVEHSVLTPAVLNSSLDQAISAKLTELEDKADKIEQGFNKVVENYEHVRKAADSLLTTNLILAHNLKLAEESRDRVLRENCELTEKNRALADIARAAVEANAAKEAFSEAECAELFDGAGPISDSVTERVATADAELEKLLNDHQALYQL
jgi:hypothetical protein